MVVANGSAFAISALDPESSANEHRNEAVVALPSGEVDPVLRTGFIWRSDHTEKGSELNELITREKRILAEDEPPPRG